MPHPSWCRPEATVIQSWIILLVKCKSTSSDIAAENDVGICNYLQFPLNPPKSLMKQRLENAKTCETVNGMRNFFKSWFSSFSCWLIKLDFAKIQPFGLHMGLIGDLIIINGANTSYNLVYYDGQL